MLQGGGKNPQTISHTPQLKQSASRSPIMQVAHEVSNKATSLVQLEEPFEFIIDRNNKAVMSDVQEDE